MKQLNLYGCSMQSLRFDEDGIYFIEYDYSPEFSYYEYLGSELEEIKEKVAKITDNPIQDNDVLFFAKDVSFPKLLLGRLDLTIKRTTKRDKATKIVVQGESLFTKDDLDNIINGYTVFVKNPTDDSISKCLFINDTHIENISKYGVTLDLMQRYISGDWIRTSKVPKVIKEDIVNQISYSPEKITTVQDLSIYLNSKLPALDEETGKTIISLFAADNESKKLAVNMISGFNISNIIFDICSAIGNSKFKFENNIKSSINYKYLRTLLGCNPSEITNEWRWGYHSKRKMLSDMFHKGITSSDQKWKIWSEFATTINGSFYPVKGGPITQNMAWQFDKYNMPYSYDEN